MKKRDFLTASAVGVSALPASLLAQQTPKGARAPAQGTGLLLRAIDGHPMPLGGLGPLWAVYDADRHADMAAKPVAERFGSCPWGLYHIEVQQA